MTQSQALLILKTGVNVFLTGEPGSGKTHTINDYVAYLKARDIEPAITASTGIASTHIGGMTIHSWSGIGIKTSLGKEDIARIKANRRVSNRIRNAKVLIIDEVSMLSPATLGMIEAVCRAVKNSPEPFGGIQIVLVGDFFQLPPVVKNDSYGAEENSLLKEKTGRFAYDSSVWDRSKFVTCYLTEQFRQDDSDFLSILSAIRRNAFDHFAHIEKRRISERDTPVNVPKLFSHNINVDRVNAEKLSKLEGEPLEFNMTTHGHEGIIESLIKSCLSPQSLQLKRGAAVMFTKNNRASGFVNGTLGEVVSFNKETGRPKIKTRGGRIIEVEPMDWTIEEGNKVLARISQLPLRLAWAITVHKSQGMSLDEAFMDLSDVFEFGQGYVALSRVRRLTGLYISGWSERAFQVHPEVLEKDAVFQNESKKAEEEYSSISDDELKKMHEDFIISCDGRNIVIEEDSIEPEKTEKPKNGFTEIRKTYPNAYQKWDDEQDERLKELFEQGLRPTEIAKILGRKRGAIHSRLKKLGLR